MRRSLLLILTLLAFRCAAPAPPPPAPVPEPAPAAPAPVEDKVLGSAKVTASALNVRAEASTEAEVVAQVKKGTTLSVLREDESWTKVRLSGGETGWVASRFLSRGGEAKSASRTRSGGGKCPPDSDFAFVETPMLAFSDSGAHGLVVVEANVNTKGIVTGTKVVSNSTGDETLAFLAEKEIKAAKFSPPIRGCAPRAFIFTYRRTY